MFSRDAKTSSPRIWPVSLLNDPKYRHRLQQILAQGGVIAYPTDTLYGLGGDFLNPRVHHRIDTLKDRTDLPYSVALWRMDALEPFLHTPPTWFRQHAGKILPGPYTLVMDASPDLEPSLLKGKVTIGVRIPAQPFPLEAMKEIAIPLISTSINRSGFPPISNPVEILNRFPNIDLMIDAGILPTSKGSTVLDLRISPPHVLRRGDGIERLSDLGIR